MSNGELTLSSWSDREIDHVRWMESDYSAWVQREGLTGGPSKRRKQSGRQRRTQSEYAPSPSPRTEEAGAYEEFDWDAEEEPREFNPLVFSPPIRRVASAKAATRHSDTEVETREQQDNPKSRLRTGRERRSPAKKARTDSGWCSFSRIARAQCRP